MAFGIVRDKSFNAIEVAYQYFPAGYWDADWNIKTFGGGVGGVAIAMAVEDPGGRYISDQ